MGQASSKRKEVQEAKESGTDVTVKEHLVLAALHKEKYIFKSGEKQYTADFAATLDGVDEELVASVLIRTCDGLSRQGNRVLCIDSSLSPKDGSEETPEEG